MVVYVLQGHELQNDVQTMIQVFLPNSRYSRREEPAAEGLSVVSRMEKGIASAMLYRNGEKTLDWSMEYTADGLDEKEQKRIVKRTLYELLRRETGIEPRWGLLTGVRPAKLISGMLAEGRSDAECMAFLTEQYLVAESKARLALRVAKAEQEILEKSRPEEISLYIGIPFCPTRCLYCSFTAYPLAQYKNRVDEYLDALFQELEFLAELLSTEGLTPCDPVENPWPEGGSPLLCQIHYGDLTVDCGGYPQAVYSRDGKILLRVGEERYQYPQETGEKLIAFLEGKKVAIE